MGHPTIATKAVFVIILSSFNVFFEKSYDFKRTCQSENNACDKADNKSDQNGNVFFITGHLHAGFSQYSFQEIEGFYSINVPAFSIENKDGEEGGNGAGLTYIIEAYDDEILFRARNCRTGEWLSKWDSKITLK